MSTDPQPAAETPAPKKKSLFVRLLPLLVIAGALAAFFGLGLNQYFSLVALEQNRDVLKSYVEGNLAIALLAFIGIYAAAVSISVPGASILTIFGGFLFGLWYGTAAVVIGATIGATIIFYVTRTAMGDVLRDKASGFVKRMEEGFREDAFSYLFSLRLIPAVPFWVLNIVPGILGVKARDYILATFLGIIPATFVYVSIGNGIDAVFDAGEQPTLSGVLFKPEIILPIVGLALLGLMPVIYKKFFASKKTDNLEGAA